MRVLRDLHIRSLKGLISKELQIKYDILVLFKIQFGNIISGFPMDRFSIGHEFPVHFFERKGK